MSTLQHILVATDLTGRSLYALERAMPTSNANCKHANKPTKHASLLDEGCSPVRTEYRATRFSSSLRQMSKNTVSLSPCIRISKV